MAKWWMMAALATAIPVLSTPAQAQNAVQDGVLVIYGQDKCPTNADGEEIVVCVRRNEAERFRIPQELRQLEVTPQNESWAARVESTLEAGDSGIGSCSAVGVGGASGCFGQAADRNRALREAREREQANIPLP